MSGRPRNHLDDRDNSINPHGEAELISIECALEQAHIRLEDFAGATSGWFWEMDANLRFTYFSASVEVVTGVPPEWHYGKTREELGMPQSVSTDQWKRHLETLERREPFNDFVFQREAPDGIKWMQTSGRPVFDAAGKFQGYRGIASDVTARVAAERQSERLMAAIENFSELFALWGPDDKLVMCNQRFREINEPVAETTIPGTRFEDHIRAALDADLYPAAVGREEEWVSERLERHRHPSVPVAMERQDGRWILLTEQRLPDGSTATVSTDITAQKQSERILAEQHEVLDTALKTIPDGVQVMDKDLRLLASNEQLFTVLDLNADEILQSEEPGWAFHRVLAQRGEYGEGNIDELIAARRAIVSSKMKVLYEWQLVSGKWVECRGNPVEGGGYVVVYRDVSERKQLMTKLESLASTDALTGALNRRKFLEVAEAEYRRALRHAHPMSILMFDVDHFKLVNDTWGHGVGDEALRHIVHLCQGTLRSEESIGRLGGEEFAVLMPETTEYGARTLAERLRELVAGDPLVVSEASVNLSISIGIAQSRDADTPLSTIIDNADSALYDAKRTGRNRVCCWTVCVQESA